MKNQFKKTMKKIGRYVWELYKSSILPSIMYCCAGMVLMMLTLKEGSTWGGSEIAWTVVCLVAAAAYHALAAWASGGNHYEMLVSGNVKRSAYDAYGNEYKISTHKEAKEYRPWKGFVSGAFVGLLPVLFGIILGCNQAKVDAETPSKGMAVALLISFFLSGWSIIPLYGANSAGGSASYFFSLLFALIPVIVSGGMYIAGAYGRRNKAIRMQILEDKAAAAEEAKKANKKINYGGLPGTKPRKRK